MVREQLQDAADSVRAASDAAADPETSERLSGLADQLETLATADRSPDHGRLARIQNAFDEVESSVNEETVEHIEQARFHVSAFRETIEGV
ncbi:hypothetical protein BRC83_07150 [Halobacteriales archaeon QS_1_68_17]|nr:MAG: hypothetical protein BRC83_07150 [Halobacteriales archaeon QS_1_68_17]